MNTFARQLSGGNQQKVVAAKWLGAHAKVLIFDEPTRGNDINGRREIYRVMGELLQQGVGILMLMQLTRGFRSADVRHPPELLRR